jgi:hypothetical protein
MKDQKKILLWVLGLLLGAAAVWQFYLFVSFRGSAGHLEASGGTIHLWLAIAATVLTCGCAFLGFFRRINQTEEFHITG